MTNDQSSYPLLPFSQLVYDTTRWLPQVYTFPFTYRWENGAADKERIEHVCRTALANHPVFSMRINWRGRQYAATPKDILHGPYHSVTLYVQGQDLLVQGKFNRILGDGMSLEILFEDIRRAYNNESLEPDDYWGYVARFEQLKNELHYNESKAWLVKEFADTAVPVRPTIDRCCLTTFLPPKAGLHIADYTDLQEKINNLSHSHYISLDGIFSLCAVLAIADYCGTDSAALTWAYEGREKEPEQRIFGSLHRDIPFKINQKSTIINNKLDLIRETRNKIRAGIAHSDYPYTLTPPYNKRWNYAVNVLRVPDLEDFLSTSGIPLKLESMQKQKYAYALFDIEILEHIDSLQLRYRYSATHYKPESIRKFAELVRKYVEWLIN